MEQREIIIEGLKKQYGETVVFDGFSECLAAGETTVLMGPSGCGKTTLFKLLMGLERPDGGRISGVPQKKAAVFQEDRLFEGFSAAANIRAVLGRKASGEQIVSELTVLGLSGAALSCPVSKLSGGMRRRVAIGRAVLAESEILFLDEPFDGLDPESKAAAVSYIKRRSAGKTVLFITHEEDEAAAMGGRIIRLGAR